MDSLKIANIIKDKFDNTVFFGSSITTGKLISFQKEKSVKFDIDNVISEIDKDDENTLHFPIDNIDEAAKILNALSDISDYETYKKIVSDFIKQNNVDADQRLYFKAYLSPS